MSTWLTVGEGARHSVERCPCFGNESRPAHGRNLKTVEQGFDDDASATSLQRSSSDIVPITGVPPEGLLHTRMIQRSPHVERGYMLPRRRRVHSCETMSPHLLMHAEPKDMYSGSHVNILRDNVRSQVYCHLEVITLRHVAL